MEHKPKIVILTGGIGAERKVSLASGRALYDSLSTRYETRLEDLTQKSLPLNLEPGRDVVFPIIHGEFGEDGELQELLDFEGIQYCGSGAESSRLCMNKAQTKNRLSDMDIKMPKGLVFYEPSECDPKEIIANLGNELVIKPVDQGSSVSLFLPSGIDELDETLKSIKPGVWLVEERIFGREVTVGVVDDQALSIVEVIPDGGVYDYQRKYSPGSTEYRCPAVLDPEMEVHIKTTALQAFRHCGCRDFARVDYIICEDGHAHLLEINTLPGLTQTSLLPKSARSSGYNFDQLVKRLLSPAIGRFNGVVRHENQSLSL